MDAIRALCIAGATPSTLSDEGYAPLHLAVLDACSERGKGMEAVLMLLAFGADPNADTARSETPLHLAVESGHIEAIQVSAHWRCMLLPHPLLLLVALVTQQQLAVLWSKARSSATPTKTAAACGNSANPPSLAAVGHSHTFYAPACPPQVLLQAGASVNSRDEDGCTPLHIACEAGHVGAMRVLLGAGSSLVSTTDDGRTPVGGNLHIARGP